MVNSATLGIQKLSIRIPLTFQRLDELQFQLPA
jgi:hypothetical protein